MNEDDWNNYKKFMTSIISGANIDSGEVQVGVVAYNQDGVTAFPMNQYKTRGELESGLMSLPLSQASDANIASGMDLVRTQMFSSGGGDRSDVPNAVMVITDADSYMERNRIASSAQSLRQQSGARVYAAGIGLSGSSQLSSVASSGSTVFSASSSGDLLTTVKDEFVAQLPPCKGY